MLLSQKPRYSGPGQDAINKWALRPKPESETGASRYGLTDDGAACIRCGQWMETDEEVDGCEDRDCPHHK